MRLHNALYLLESLNANVELESLESSTETEREFCFFGSLVDLNDLKEFDDYEYQVQAEVKQDKGRFRVRSTYLNSDAANIKYTLTVKTLVSTEDSGPPSFTETTTDIDETFFQQMLIAIGTCMHKRRYLKPVANGEKWEIDVFTNDRGVPSGWVKLDYETRSDTVPEYPIELYNILDCGIATNQPKISEILKLVAQDV